MSGAPDIPNAAILEGDRVLTRGTHANAAEAAGRSAAQ
jgi:hypothetical protein